MWASEMHRWEEWKKIEKNVEELSKKKYRYVYVFSEMSDNDYKNEAQMMVIMIVVGY